MIAPTPSSRQQAEAARAQVAKVNRRIRSHGVATMADVLGQSPKKNLRPSASSAVKTSGGGQ
jgi:hypothetical protein